MSIGLLHRIKWRPYSARTRPEHWKSQSSLLPKVTSCRSITYSSPAKHRRIRLNSPRSNPTGQVARMAIDFCSAVRIKRDCSLFLTISFNNYFDSLLFGKLHLMKMYRVRTLLKATNSAPPKSSCIWSCYISSFVCQVSGESNDLSLIGKHTSNFIMKTKK